MSLRWGADDDTLSLGMGAGGKDIASRDTAMNRADLDAWDRSKRRSAVKRDKSAKSAALGQQKTFKTQLAAQSAGQLVQAGLMVGQAGMASARYDSVKGAQAGVGAKQAKVDAKIAAGVDGEGRFGGKSFFGNRQNVLGKRQVRLDARQTKLGQQRLAMEEANPSLVAWWK